MSGLWDGTSNELASAICDVLELKKCVWLSIDFDFEGLPRVMAELLLDKDATGEVKRIIQQYDLHPEKIVQEKQEHEQ